VLIYLIYLKRLRVLRGIIEKNLCFSNLILSVCSYSLSRAYSNDTTSAPLSTEFSNSRYNQAGYTLEPDSNSTVYIFQCGLFTQTLLPIDLSKNREMLLQYTT